VTGRGSRRSRWSPLRSRSRKVSTAATACLPLDPREAASIACRWRGADPTTICRGSRRASEFLFVGRAFGHDVRTGPSRTSSSASNTTDGVRWLGATEDRRRDARLHFFALGARAPTVDLESLAGIGGLRQVARGRRRDAARRARGRRVVPALGRIGPADAGRAAAQRVDAGLIYLVLRAGVLTLRVLPARDVRRRQSR
jgi:hypothetical protein